MSIRIIISGGREYIADNPQILVGRRDPNSGGEVPDLCLDADRAVGRRHARVSFDGGNWTIEDLGSKNGTMVNGADIGRMGQKPFHPGDVISTGATLWMAIPSDWIYILRDHLLICGPCGRVLSYGLRHCGHRLLHTIYIIHLGKDRSRNCTLQIGIEGYSETIAIRIPELGPGERLELQTPPLKPDFRRLKKIQQPETAKLVFSMDPLRQKTQRDVTILGYWHLPLSPETLEAAAAFVLPLNPAVRRLVDGAQENLAGASFHQLLKSADDAAERKVLQSLYEYMNARYSVSYEYPNVQSIPGGTFYFQPVRPPHMIFDPVHSGGATCADLSFAFAACLESLGLNPLIFFVSDGDEAWKHCFLGCWIGAAPGTRPLIHDRNFLLQELESGNLIVLETTGIARGAFSGRETLDFTEALEQAERLLRGVQKLAAVDICALRPPNGRLTPMECLPESEASGVFEAAEQLAVDKNRARIETSFLLYGLLNAGGDVTAFLLGRLGCSCKEQSARLYERIAEGKAPHAFPVPTLNYMECKRLAEEHALQDGSPSVREQDIWWALLYKYADSPKLKELFRALEMDAVKLQYDLSLHYPSSLQVQKTIGYSGNLYSKKF